MFRLVRVFAAAAIVAALIAPPNVVSGVAGGNGLSSRLDSLLYSAAASSTAQVSVIVELKDEPGAVFKARAEKAGGTVSTDQLKAYRDGLSAKQDDFLNALTARGVAASLVTRDVRNYDGNIAATAPS